MKIRGVVTGGVRNFSQVNLSVQKQIDRGVGEGILEALTEDSETA